MQFKLEYSHNKSTTTGTAVFPMKYNIIFLEDKNAWAFTDPIDPNDYKMVSLK
jgi:hypothetical protein